MREYKSKYDSNLEFDENEWVVSLINTKSGISSIYGGHAKIVVEGLKRSNTLIKELFVAEYHIMEAERMPEETWIPQALRNTQCKYAVLFKEDNKYNRTNQQYAETQSRSHGGIKPADAMKMIQDIKQEKQNIDSGQIAPDFQYAGEWCLYSYQGGHNCTTWAEKKLDIIGAGRHLITDSSKAAPYLHVNSGNSGCSIF